MLPLVKLASNVEETFGYDRNGNRTEHDKFYGTTQAAESNITDPTIDPATNRFTAGQGYTFDKNSGLDFAEARMYENRHEDSPPSIHY